MPRKIGYSAVTLRSVHYKVLAYKIDSLFVTVHNAENTSTDLGEGIRRNGVGRVYKKKKGNEILGENTQGKFSGGGKQHDYTRRPPRREECSYGFCRSQFTGLPCSANYGRFLSEEKQALCISTTQPQSGSHSFIYKGRVVPFHPPFFEP